MVDKLPLIILAINATAQGEKPHINLVRNKLKGLSIYGLVQWATVLHVRKKIQAALPNH